ncbi:hypothetical protein IQ265_17490 [Nodosilinea sp. LEGE 06152]|uniref:hypothetical protein n=1 Tax=Nodosilinea sp. LEGE 06152 TaxID=2777966 RepID=UPI00188051DE|nr:hypothetical protein [Nodosilinea sp. LEGE 06152]MBE9158611.1 hypothetical protein [Nodosilinea sp. LEGE 06152]
MHQDRSLRTLIRVHWLSWALMVLAHVTYGGFLHDRNAGPTAWLVSVVLAICGAGAITLFWPLIRRVILLGFQSDMGYFVMALSVASLAVVAVTQFQLFAYFSMMVAVSLLARVDNLILGVKDTAAFFLLAGLALLGLALSWLPQLLWVGN